MQGRTGRRTGGASGIPLDARIKDDTPEMLKNLWKTRITRGGWFPTSTIDPPGSTKGLENRFVRIQRRLDILVRCREHRSLGVLYSSYRPRYEESQFQGFVLPKNKTTSPLLFNPVPRVAHSCRSFSRMENDHPSVYEFVSSILLFFFFFFFFVSLRVSREDDLERKRGDRGKKRRVRTL